MLSEKHLTFSVKRYIRVRIEIFLLSNLRAIFAENLREKSLEFLLPTAIK